MYIPIIFWLVFLMRYPANCIKVCPTFRDYDIRHNPKCFENPVTRRNISEIIKSWPGFTAEEHYVTTEDGYKLLIERSYLKITNKTPLILVHGICMNALNWVNRGNVSLAKILGELGYDVWMLNYRGTLYSRGHVNLTSSDKNFWTYNLNELGIHDVRSTVTHVIEQTKHKPIYIGYSMETTGFFIYSLTYPEEAKQNIKGFICLAPGSHFLQVKSIIKYIEHIWPIFKKIITILWNGEILRGLSKLLKPLVKHSKGIYFLQSILNLICGDDFDQIDALNYPQFAIQTIDTVAVDVLGHFLQFFRTGTFSKFDYGKQKNLIVYGSENPPLYDVSKIDVPISMFVGENDWITTLQGAQYTYSQLKPSQRCGFHTISFKKWTHIDFLIAKDIPTYLFKPLFKKIKQLDDGLCVI